MRRAAMNALISVRGKETDMFTGRRQVRQGRTPTATRPSGRCSESRSSTGRRSEAKPLLDDVLAYIRKIPVAERKSPAALDALQLADSLASLLPLDEAKKVRRELGELGVRVIRLSTLPDQMLFDKDRIVVKAGKPVEVVFENEDLMPHNFVVTQPGSLEEVGTADEAAAAEPGALDAATFRSRTRCCAASRLLQPRESQRLDFIAPKQPGVYPYVCTYPGHWRRMYGALYVVEDLDEYLADPEATWPSIRCRSRTSC